MTITEETLPMDVRATADERGSTASTNGAVTRSSWAARFGACLLLAGLCVGRPTGASQTLAEDVPYLAFTARMACSAGYNVGWVQYFIASNPPGEKVRQAIAYLERLQ